MATFGCALRNEIEEGFIGVQRQIKHTVQELLRVYLRGESMPAMRAPHAISPVPSA